jgi:cytochrome c-type biogenesis protein CcmH
MMIPPIAFVLALTLASPALAGEAQPLAEDPVLEQRMIKLAEDLRCLVCQNESLAGSRAELAQDLRREIKEQLKAGKSDKEVIIYLTQRYGDFVLYRPPMKPVTWLLWFGPFVLLLAAVTGFFLYLRRRNQLAKTAFSEEERRRVESLLNADKEPS